MAEQLCCCSRFMRDPDLADFVFAGTPACNARCYKNACEAEARKWREEDRGRAARDVPVGKSWVFTDHRSLAEVDRPTRIVGTFERGFHVVD